MSKKDNIIEVNHKEDDISKQIDIIKNNNSFLSQDGNELIKTYLDMIKEDRDLCNDAYETLVGLMETDGLNQTELAPSLAKIVDVKSKTTENFIKILDLYNKANIEQSKLEVKKTMEKSPTLIKGDKVQVNYNLNDVKNRVKQLEKSGELNEKD